MNLRDQQKVQYQHDLANHLDILSLPRVDRLKHYGLHFAKYAGRLARGTDETKSVHETLVDTFLVCLSAANVLNQALPGLCFDADRPTSNTDFTNYSGQFADACEKIDHLEEFREIALRANLLIATWMVNRAHTEEIDLIEMAEHRRKQLSDRLVFNIGS